MSTSIQPWQVWWANFDPTMGHEQAGRRPAIVVSSPFQLALTNSQLISVLMLTTRERPGWTHRVRVDLPGKRTGWVITEQIRTVSRTRIFGKAPLATLNGNQIEEIRAVLTKMMDL